MTSLDLKRLETALETRAEELVRSLAQRNHINIEKVADAYDEAVESAARENSARTLTQDFRLLREVEAARSRLRAGIFGICASCEEEIAPKRLQAIPWAVYCVSCQAKVEEDEASLPGLERAA